MRDCVEIGPTPVNEPCAQTVDPDYAARARPECQRFIDLIRRQLGPEPAGAELRIKENRHRGVDTYYEVACYYESDNKVAAAYAWRCQDEAPTNWTPLEAGEED